MTHAGSALSIAPPIEALEWLTALRKLRTEFGEIYGFEPENLSHWNPKAQFRDELNALVAPPRSSPSFTEYVYTTDLDHHQEVLDRLHEPGGRSCLFTPSGTTSIGNVVAYLRNIGVTSVGAVRPYYFAFEEFAQFCGLVVQPFTVVRDPSGQYHLPSAKAVMDSGCTAVWLTSPVYGTSVYYDDAELRDWLADLAAGGMIVIVDESLAHVDRATIASTSDLDRYFAIYVPHKALSLNGFRFSAMTFPAHLSDSFDQWSDLFSGGLPSDSMAALRHFCSPDYATAVGVARAQQDRQADKLRKLAGGIEGVDLDPTADGHFQHVYVRDVPAALQTDMTFLKGIFFAAGASFIPAARFGHPLQSGFCFRVNLLRLDDAAMGGLYRVLKELTGAGA
jgi:histidinol-phosphate/aromatic aminotransferase/cobyric acid decarboxylase-like protein